MIWFERCNMDNFELYHCLCSACRILEFYPPAEKTLTELEALADKVSGKLYRVAVIGEFKRGKSSLINSLLGTEILPTDILPATAVINRIKYDTQQKIEIHYKDGRVEETTIESLCNYATKLDADKEKISATVKEIIVYYPSVFGQNNIEMIDTPGLNDEDLMTQKTFGVLEEIDTAIVVLSATMPLSITEQKLICSLIEQKNIYHLTFVVTFIDRVSDEEEEQDRVIELLKSRIENDTFELFAKSHSEDENALKKAEKILKNPALFAISSKQAINGFIKNDYSLINRSRFPHFKLQLMALLTANQELDVRESAKDIMRSISMEFGVWTEEKRKKIAESMLYINERVKNINAVAESRHKTLICDLLMVDKKIEEYGFSLENNSNDFLSEAFNYKKCFITQLASIRTSEMSAERVKKALYSGVAECMVEAKKICDSLQKCIFNAMNETEEALVKRNQVCEINFNSGFYRNENDFPCFSYTFDDIALETDNIMGNIMTVIINTFTLACRKYSQKVILYIAAWRASMLRTEKECAEQTAKRIEELRKEIENFADEAEKFDENIQEHIDEINEISEKFEI